MFSSMPLQDFNRPFYFFVGMNFAFQPFYFTVSFRDNSNSVILCFWFLQVVSCLSHIGEGGEGSSLAEKVYTRAFFYYAIQSSLLCHALHQLLLSVASCQNIDCITHTKSYGGLVGKWFVMLKGIWGTTGLWGGKPFDFTQSFCTAL